MKGVLGIDDIKTCVAQVAEIFDLKKVTLFGSYANGQCTKKSDIDLLVDFGQKQITIYDIAHVKLMMQDLTKKNVDVIACPVPHGSLIEIGKEILLYAQ